MTRDEEIAAGVLVLAGVAGLVYYFYFYAPPGTVDITDLNAVADDGTGAAVPTDNATFFGLDSVAQVFGDIGLTTPRGLRNHNPGNLRYIDPSRAFNGQVGNDGGYGVYASDELGARAMGKELQKYWAAGRVTPRLIVETWAPRSENDTAAYINAICQRLQCQPDTNVANIQTLGLLMDAMIHQEQGYNPFAVSDLQYWGTEA